ncbi:response regulator transcription factor [Corynebacterium sp. 320]|uniref:Response regulator transcription factor n=1 Tax=Corynebacterium zhongnanshanii TaxID=2768834 RepID=A0ABQ6VGM2_9CORY|nr:MULTISPECIES: response regulator transcription factor [Corynebacterium]KAB1503804.1 response regulator transcription factor [Corynebacterium sp. 320]KAB1553096.1 response regulator transcription factor [Corynebacterium sp. 321]KAB1553686.1 response regulator transcription factor [Corynebacterium sp. 319]KAB3523344.1 response regulator transcription factor [Corynebacterium zhongnanshanii]KAB3527940.1 response regulator transcription factor [Corynebacterium sp. 250]
MIRVLIADDHPVVRAGLASMVEGHDVDVVASVDSAQEAVELCSTTPVDVVLMDLRFGETPNSTTGDGVWATEQIRALPNPPQVLVVTNYSTDSDVMGAISAGAVGYLLKDCGPTQLLEGIRQAHRGETVLSPNVMGKVMGRLSNPIEKLTARELDVLREASLGKSNRLIARQLVLTEATVKSHLTHVFAKLGVNNRTAAVAVARERGIL